MESSKKTQEQEAKEYLHAHNLTQIFQDLTTTLIVYKPKQPLNFLIDILIQLRDGKAQPKEIAYINKMIAKSQKKAPITSQKDRLPPLKVQPKLAGRSGAASRIMTASDAESGEEDQEETAVSSDEEYQASTARQLEIDERFLVLARQGFEEEERMSPSSRTVPVVPSINTKAAVEQQEEPSNQEYRVAQAHTAREWVDSDDEDSRGPSQPEQSRSPGKSVTPTTHWKTSGLDSDSDEEIQNLREHMILDGEL